MPFAATQMGIEIITLNGVNQRKTNIILYHLYMESKKMMQMKLIYKIEIDSQIWKTNLWLSKGKEKEEINQQFGINRYALL